MRSKDRFTVTQMPGYPHLVGIVVAAYTKGEARAMLKDYIAQTTRGKVTRLPVGAELRKGVMER